jgi:hypothetical protein
MEELLHVRLAALSLTFMLQAGRSVADLRVRSEWS